MVQVHRFVDPVWLTAYDGFTFAACVVKRATLRAQGRTDTLVRVRDPMAERATMAGEADTGAVGTGGAGLGGLGVEIGHRLPALKALTSLRFFAAVHVVVYHMIVDGAHTSVPLLHNFVASGYTGIFLFFILSGFILAYNYREVPNRRLFWVSRFARIYPVYLLALLLGVAYAFAPTTPPTDHPGMRLGLSAALLQAWYGPFVDSFNPPGWTLSVETFFYVIFPFAIAWIRRSGRAWFFSGCALYLAVFCVPVLMRFWMPSSRSPVETAHFLVRGTMPLLHLPMFLIGAYLGVSYLKRAAATGGGRATLAGGAVSTLALLCWAPAPLLLPIRTWLLIMAYAALILGLASVRSGWLTSRWMVLGGEISYSIYILQMPVMRTVLAVTRRLGIGYYGGVAAVLVTLIPISFLAYRFVELPARVAIRNRLTHKPVSLVKL